MKHLNARKSEVPNLGADIPGSARAVRGGKRSLDELEELGIADKEIKRDKLLKNFPPAYKKINLQTAYAHLFLLKMPTKPSKSSEEHALAGRKNYLVAYETIKLKVEEAANLESEDSFSPSVLMSELKNIVLSLINDFRKENRLCPAANSLIPYYNNILSDSRFQKKSILRTEVKSLAEEYDANPSQEALENIVLKNMSVFKAFGNKKPTNSDALKRKDLYGSSIERKGPKKLNFSRIKIDERLLKTFKAIEYGNYVSDKERLMHKELLIQAFADLTLATGLDIKKLTGDGKLSIGLGSRGRGKALASYTPDYDIINLTKKNGFGSLSHEVGHFIDKEITRKHMSAAHYLTSTSFKAMELLKIDSDLIDILAKIRALHEVIRKRLLEDDMFLLLAKGRVQYWLSGHEIFARAFESYVFNKLKEQGITNDYLSISISCIFWPTKEEMEIYTPLIEKYISFI